MSAVLWDYAMPILAPMEERDLGEVRTGITIAMAAWNATVLEQECGDVEGWRILLRSLSGADREEMRGLLAFLRERKLELFPDDQRHVVNVKVTQGEDQYHLAVASIGT